MRRCTYLVLTLISCVVLVLSDVTEYRSCLDVKQKLQSNATDGQYVIFINSNVGVPIYCAGLSTNQPKEYLTLPSGPTNNFASVYPQIGDTTSCTDKSPMQTYSKSGRSEYSKIRINIKTFEVDTTDFTFSQLKSGQTQIRYGHAGDMHTSAYFCPAKGTFKVDLTGTPFLIKGHTQWKWKGVFQRGSRAYGQPVIKNSTYVGCFKDKNVRLFNDHFEDMQSSATTERCIQICKKLGYWYAGTQFSSQCFCGDQPPRYEKLADPLCNAPCRGNTQEKCGGTWKMSVHRTDLPQIVEGRCGGYPAMCFPALSDTPTVDQLDLQVVPSHPCLQPLSPCENEGVCVATTGRDYKCLCYDGFRGTRCDIADETTITDGSNCPVGMVPEQCMCTSHCSGAQFQGDTCTTLSSSPKLVCRTGNPGHVIMFNVEGSGVVKCPAGSKLTGCTYWDTNGHVVNLNGQADQIRYNVGTCQLLHDCQGCKLQARCKQYVCGCENGGHCHQVTGKCVCTNGYYGDKCESFDYCGFYERQNNVSTCGDGGICTAIASQEIKASGGVCLMPFSYSGQTFGKCADTNMVGPPFACGSLFDGSRDGYIDLGNWSPGTRYTIAAWVRPDVADRTRRTIVGGVGNCRDFGIYQFENFWTYIKQAPKTRTVACTKGLGSSVPITTGQWYLVANVRNATHTVLYVNGQSIAVQTDPDFLPTSSGLWIGGEICCPSGRFKGMIKTVKIWKRPLSLNEINHSMNSQGNSLSTMEALTGGLVGHWELGETFDTPCAGLDHGGEDWVISDDRIISGTHCNISRFYVQKLVTVTVKPWDGTSGGTLQIQAQNIQIDGELNADGSGYRGGASPAAGGSGHQGESYPGLGSTSTNDNRGGGGGGVGGAQRGDGKGMPGAGAGYATLGKVPIKLMGDTSGLGSPGKMYGSATVKPLYLGSGGGSGGSAKSLTSTPAGGKGGNGGGAISLMAKQSVIIKGYLSTKGENGQGDDNFDQSCTSCPKSCSTQSRANCQGTSTSACWDDSGPGGGGSGGSVFISGQLVDIGRNQITVTGGLGGYGARQGCGGAGGMGRVRVEAIIIRGALDTHLGSLSQDNLQGKYIDHSQEGQKMINYKNTTYGNEIYLGCFTDKTYRFLANRVSLSSTQARQMTPDLCMSLCRQKGYMYSGVEYSTECYCDNHAQMSQRRPDAECNMKCSGSNAMCGGNYHISVYGPPPGAAGITHGGAASTCQPWCVTSDQNTANPKWGVCSLQNQYVSSWNITCDCPAGYTGIGCKQTCREGTWGAACGGNCTCNMNNTAVCDPQTGNCQCKGGYYGDDCNTPCYKGTFGDNCMGRCNCSDTSTCDIQTGACICNKGWYGEMCNFPCPAGKYGRNCEGNCKCFHGTCDPVAGTCGCLPGFKLPFCSDQCDPYTYGPNCEFNCNCNGQRCDTVTGQCICDPGYTGQHCGQPCPQFTFGKGCTESCDCTNAFNCDHRTGACLCEPGYIGSNCETTCPSGTFGINCQRRCLCQMNQTERCDPSTGLCSCKPGYLGGTCKTKCPLGTFGVSCSSTCACENGASCDPLTGACVCQPGFHGNLCQTPCDDIHAGVNCSLSCGMCDMGFCNKVTAACQTCEVNGCNCPSGFFGQNCQGTCRCIHGLCLSNGTCACAAGWKGDICDTPCPTGQYGKDCARTCTCTRGTCHLETGTCICPDGYYGPKCDKPCVNNTYGADCLRACPGCGRYSNGTCDRVTGNCDCMTGYQGPQCQIPCQDGYYGDKCKQRCSCQNGARCKNTDGVCICPDGFYGNNCESKCPVGTWGFNCSNNCLNCGAHTNGCDPRDGKCICTPGFTGVTCQESCPKGTYGQDCNQQCQCDMDNYYTCSPIDGSCECKSGYSGQYCALVCMSGKWGHMCEQNCQCNNRGNCNPFNGQCDCQAGYNGTRCDISCPPNKYYGKNCAHQCNCNGSECNPANGLCSCKPGTKGPHCGQKCEPTHYGFQCSQLCGCKNEGVCDPIDGSCKCQPGWSGQFCDQSCPEGHYGVYCAQTCPNCENGASCDSVTGACQCTTGFEGQLCNRSCAPGTWGDRCSNVCPSLCPTSCFPVTGQCSCTPGSCQNGGTCNENKICVCQLGFSGSDCSLHDPSIAPLRTPNSQRSTSTITKPMNTPSQSVVTPSKSQTQPGNVQTHTPSKVTKHMITSSKSVVYTPSKHQSQAGNVQTHPQSKVTSPPITHQILQSTHIPYLSGNQSSDKDKGMYVWSKGQMAGLVIGLILLTLVAVCAMYILMRKKYTGSILGDNGHGVSGSNLTYQSDDDRGFTNPLHFSHSTEPPNDTESVKDSAA